MNDGIAVGGKIPLTIIMCQCRGFPTKLVEAQGHQQGRGDWVPLYKGPKDLIQYNSCPHHDVFCFVCFYLLYQLGTGGRTLEAKPGFLVYIIGTINKCTTLCI